MKLCKIYKNKHPKYTNEMTQTDIKIEITVEKYRTLWKSVKTLQNIEKNINFVQKKSILREMPLKS